MAKFRKRVKIAPGITANLSKSGVSGTFGVKGASVNVNKNGTFANTGIPGTGIYDRHKISGAPGADEADADEAGEVSARGVAPPMGKIGRRVFFILFLVSAVFAITSIFRGHFFWAFLQGALAIGMLITPALYNARPADQSEEEPESGEEETAPESEATEPVPEEAEK